MSSLAEEAPTGERFNGEKLPTVVNAPNVPGHLEHATPLADTPNPNRRVRLEVRQAQEGQFRVEAAVFERGRPNEWVERDRYGCRASIESRLRAVEYAGEVYRGYQAAYEAARQAHLRESRAMGPERHRR